MRALKAVPCPPPPCRDTLGFPPIPTPEATWGGREGGGLSEREEITFDDRRPSLLPSMRVASAFHWDQANETKEPQKQQRTRCRHKEPRSSY